MGNQRGEKREKGSAGDQAEELDSYKWCCVVILFLEISITFEETELLPDLASKLIIYLEIT